MHVFFVQPADRPANRLRISLPRVLLSCCFQFVGDGATWARVRVVSKAWHAAANNPMSWNTLSFDPSPSLLEFGKIKETIKHASSLHFSHLRDYDWTGFTSLHRLSCN